MSLKRLTPDAWQNHIRSWQQSGLSQKVYCQQHQLGLSTFHSKYRLQIIGAMSMVGVHVENISKARHAKAWTLGEGRELLFKVYRLQIIGLQIIGLQCQW